MMFGFFKNKKEENISNNKLKKLIDSIHSKTGYVYSPNDIKGVEEYENLKSLTDNEIKVVILQLIEEYIKLKTVQAKKANHTVYDSKIYLYYADNIIEALIAGLLRRKLNYNEEEWIEVFEKIKSFKVKSSQFATYDTLSRLPINYAIKQIEYYQKDNPISTEVKSYIKGLLKWKEFSGTKNSSYYGSDLNKSRKKLLALLGDSGELQIFKMKQNDIGEEVNNIIGDIKQKESNFNQIFLLASGVSGSKPTAKFLKELNKNLDEIGLANFKTVVHKLLSIPLSLKVQTTTHTNVWNNQEYTYNESTFLTSQSQIFIKGLVWCCHRFSDKETINLLTKLAEKSYTKIPGKGPAAASLGNACVYILGNMKGKDGLGALSRLKLKVRQNNVKKSIDKLLDVGAKKYNVSVEELKEMAVPNYGLSKGNKTIEFDDYNFEISVDGTKINQQWIKPDGNLMKSVPSVVKNKPALKNKLQSIRKEIKEIKKVVSAQKQRIDNQFITDRTWDLASFNKYYLDHGLVYPITSKLIWTFIDGDKSVDAYFRDGQWFDLNENLIDWINSDTKIKLWHPIDAYEKEITAWREKIISLQWRQPIKQAYREIYILTDAEVNTKSYSNRMAAHILKQHQFSSLASIRNWKYSLLGAYDDGRDNEICSKQLPEHGIKAEYWIDELNQEDAFNDAGIWNYIATDQVKFKDDNDNTLDLINIPKIVFSEVMRDVDLFVGVASVGNDPQWIDNNGERQTYRDYWTSYSFGDLSQIAKTRKSILEGLLPRLKKIRDRAKIEGKFLIIDGKVRTYKIHIGSGNILMEPNDEYLCIVPSRSSEKTTSNLFIPFEGDRGLSIVLSKAFLLAEDDKIEDSVILNQINRI